MAKKTKSPKELSSGSSKTKQKAEASSSANSPGCYVEQSNLLNIVGSGVLSNFVKDNKGAWDHDGWLRLCGEIKEKGWSPVDFDKVGLVLEKEKSAYLVGEPTT